MIPIAGARIPRGKQRVPSDTTYVRPPLGREFLEYYNGVDGVGREFLEYYSGMDGVGREFLEYYSRMDGVGREFLEENSDSNSWGANSSRIKAKTE